MSNVPETELLDSAKYSVLTNEIKRSSNEVATLRRRVQREWSRFKEMELARSKTIAWEKREQMLEITFDKHERTDPPGQGVLLPSLPS